MLEDHNLRALEEDAYFAGYESGKNSVEDRYDEGYSDGWDAALDQCQSYADDYDDGYRSGYAEAEREYEISFADQEKLDAWDSLYHDVKHLEEDVHWDRIDMADVKLQLYRIKRFMERVDE